ncbi:prephenate dehydrogenase [Clostridium sp. Marseille-P2415]|uniref:prephenate dehydrogenase n=1 Tax=Clostridium sp. Marseille-P2415 TaxID=1805471 RepID=UPI0009887696|nr:prephenate dehydrogenase [Clostridium sp. Marseille-P2415]
MSDAIIAFIGLGLIGGSIARGIKREEPDTKIMAYMRTRSRLLQAKEEGIVDVVLEGIGEELRECDLIFLCTPVEYNAKYLSGIRPFLKLGAIVTDVGSTKTDIHEEVIRLDMESWFVGGHPMAGSEKTGYGNSTDHLLENAYYIITPTAHSTEDQVNRLVRISRMIGSIPIVLDYHEHDFVTAAISHLPHIVASSLVNLVKDSDNEQGLMKRLAAGGFKDITRIASSSPEMWEQICMTNSQNLSVILDRYIASLSQIQAGLKAKDSQYIYQLFETSRDYRSTFSEKTPGPIAPDYSFTVDMADKVGAISTLSVILAAKGISIKNIGINHNREHGEGTLRIAFYDREAMDNAWKQLERYHYDLISN